MTATVEVLVRFVDRLRREGIPVSGGTGAEVMRVVDMIGFTPPSDVFFGLRAVCCTNVDQYPAFSRAFMGFFRAQAEPALLTIERNDRGWSIHQLEAEGRERGSESMVVGRGASASERLKTKDFSQLTPAETAQIQAMIDRMTWAPALTMSRRHRADRSGSRPDLRRTLRGLIGPEADLMHIEFTDPKPRRRPLLLIADVSGSMESYTEMLLYFAHAARGRLGRLEAFVFATHLTRITRQMERRDPTVAIREVSGAVTDWSSGTRIGESIGTFNRVWSRRVGRGGPIAVIVSDGWDRGDPDTLSREMARLHRSVHRVIWLNPLAGRSGYTPKTRGIRAALPYIDDFLPVTNFSNLEQVVKALESVSPNTRPVKTAG